MQHLPTKEEFEQLPKKEQKQLVDKTDAMLKPLNRAERRAEEKNNRKLRRQKRKVENGT